MYPSFTRVYTYIYMCIYIYIYNVYNVYIYILYVSAHTYCSVEDVMNRSGDTVWTLSVCWGSLATRSVTLLDLQRVWAFLGLKSGGKCWSSWFWCTRNSLALFGNGVYSTSAILIREPDDRPWDFGVPNFQANFERDSFFCWSKTWEGVNTLNSLGRVDLYQSDMTWGSSCEVEPKPSYFFVGNSKTWVWVKIETPWNTMKHH